MGVRHNYEYVKSVFESNGCTLLSDSYKDNKQRLVFICNCGNEATISFNQFAKGTRCKSCGYKKASKTKTLSHEFIRGYFEENECKLLSIYEASDIPLRYICKCGRESTIRWDNFKQGQRCRDCYIESISGSNHYKFNTLITDEERGNRRHLPEYREWRIKVFERDRYRCQCCSKRSDGDLVAHHIVNFMEHESLRYEVDNGITLCEACHFRFHITYGFRHNNRQQLDTHLESRRNGGLFVLERAE